MAVGIQSLGEVAISLEVGGHRVERARTSALANTLPVGEEKCSIANDRPAYRGAELVERKWNTRLAGTIAEKIVCIERFVPEEIPGAAMELIGAALGDEVDNAAARSSIFGAGVSGDDAELLGRVRRECDLSSPRGVVLSGRAIHHDVVHRWRAARDGDAAVRVGGPAQATEASQRSYAWYQAG
jgi:hypothetical protein